MKDLIKKAIIKLLEHTTRKTFLEVRDEMLKKYSDILLEDRDFDRDTLIKMLNRYYVLQFKIQLLDDISLSGSYVNSVSVCDYLTLQEFTNAVFNGLECVK